MKKIVRFFKAFKGAAVSFIDDNAFKLSASLSYYTIFAICPLLIIVISLAGIIFGKIAVQGEIYNELNALVGSEAALQIQSIIGNIQQTESGTMGAIIGFVILFIGASGVFTEMQDSINYIWSVKAKPKRGWLKFILNRLLSFSLIISMGFILLVSLAVNAIMDILSGKLQEAYPQYDFKVFYIINLVILFLCITALFTIIFKVLPDAVISWKDAIVGACVTSVLFMIGKYLISYYVQFSDIGITYGAAASIIIILVWVYYSAMLLYFGAEFTKIYALQSGSGIKPKQTAVFIIKKESKEVPTSYLNL